MTSLSELSKPVAYKFDHGVMGPGDFKYGTPQMHSTAKDENASPLYSQEYVSALLARIAELEGQLQSGFTPEALAQEERAENAEQRVAELEAIATDYAGKFQKAQDANKHLIIMNNDDKRRIAELEAEGKVWASAATKHLARAEEAEQRVAELSELETHNQCLIKKNADLTQQNIKLGERLATPVRLPGSFYPDGDIDLPLVVELDEAVEAIRAAGFTVEGDE